MKKIIEKAKKQGYSVYKVFDKGGKAFDWIYVSDYNNCIYIQKNDVGEYQIIAKIRYGTDFEILRTDNTKEIDLYMCFEASRIKNLYYKMEKCRPATIEDIIKDYKRFGWKLLAV